MKKCSKCGVVQPLSNYYAAKGTRDGLRGDCKDCFKQRAAARYRANPGRAKERARRWAREHPEEVRERMRRYRETGQRQANDRRSYLKRKFGITLERYDEMLAAQGGVCAICGRPPRDDISLHVDHDHETGAIRGLLCFRCNNALGDFDDERGRLHKAVVYLDSHDPETVMLVERARQRVQALRRAG